MVRRASTKRSTKRALVRPGDQMQDDFGVGGGLHHRAFAHQLAAQRQAVGQIAVVADGKTAGVSSANSGCTLRMMVSPVVE